MTGIELFFIIIIACVLAFTIDRFMAKRNKGREAYIREFPLPRGLLDTLLIHHPQLTLTECELVAQGLRQFFLVHLKSSGQFVSMPSQVVDDLWHAFILYTRAYEQFCKKAYGRTLHHSPSVILDSRHQGSKGIRRTWKYACAEEHIDPKNPSRLPLLFELDSKLAIVNGIVYVPDCNGVTNKKTASGTDCNGGVYCGAVLGNDADADGVLDDIEDGGDINCGAGCGGGCGGCGGGGD